MEKKNILIAVAVIAVAAFFYPKQIGGSTCGLCPGYPYPQFEETGCFGIKQTTHQTCADCGDVVNCYGLPLPEKKCFSQNPTGPERLEVQCLVPK
ncbi:MAG: hypothetical protein V1708_02520 [Candidatus Micrarchaeota archaeon]